MVPRARGGTRRSLSSRCAVKVVSRRCFMHVGVANAVIGELSASDHATIMLMRRPCGKHGYPVATILSGSSSRPGSSTLLLAHLARQLLVTVLSRRRSCTYQIVLSGMPSVALAPSRITPSTSGETSPHGLRVVVTGMHAGYTMIMMSAKGVHSATSTSYLSMRWTWRRQGGSGQRNGRPVTASDLGGGASDL